MSLIQKALEKNETADKQTTQPIDLEFFLKKPTEKLPVKDLPLESSRFVQWISHRGFKVSVFVLLVFVQATVIYYFLFLRPSAVFKYSSLLPVPVMKNASSAPMAKAVPAPSVPVVQTNARQTRPLDFVPMSTVPMILPRQKPESASNFVLAGITVKGADKFAIINNEVVTLGAEVGPGTYLRDILENEKKVVLESRGQKIVLKL
jgi:hypothetical protein